jgi:hypothetical protein
MTRRRLGVMLGCGLGALILADASPSAAQQAPGQVPLQEVLALAKPYPNLQFEVKAELLRAGVKKEDVACTGHNFPPDWSRLAGVRHGPYACRIGKRTLIVAARETFYDVNGHKLAPDTSEARVRAAKVVETGLKWRWR